MKKQLGFLVAFTCILFCAQIAAAQQKEKVEISYKEGAKNWERDVAKHILKYINHIPHDYLLFFEISLNKKGIRSVKELYSSPDKTSNEVYMAIKDISTNWTSKSRQFTNVIIPTFLRKDLDNAKIDFQALSFNSGSKDYPNLRELRKCFLTPPVVFIFSEPVR